jgi:hypothetical protein
VNEATPITEDALRAAGFKWLEVERSDRHWLLWIGNATDGSFDDLGIELCPNRDGEWYCWLRADYAGRYSRFIHVRHLRSMEDVAALFAGLTGSPWNPENHLYGLAHTSERAEILRVEADRLDRRIARQHDNSPRAWTSDVAAPDAARPMVGWQPPTKASA